MGFKIVRNDITKMNTEAIVNTANENASVGPGCDSAVYMAAGSQELLAYRTEKIGFVPEGNVFITPGFHLKARYIIHAVSPLYRGGEKGEEEKLRSCYRKSLMLAKEKGIKSLAFPLISTGGFGYPKEEGLRIAVDEIRAFLLNHEMDVFLVVFDDEASTLGKRIAPGLKEYIDRNYIEERYGEEYSAGSPERRENRLLLNSSSMPVPCETAKPAGKKKEHWLNSFFRKDRKKAPSEAPSEARENFESSVKMDYGTFSSAEAGSGEDGFLDFEGIHENKLEERMRHLPDTFSQYLLYLIREKRMENAEVYKRAIVDKKTFSKIKNNMYYHPQKMTALCLCVGAKLNLDESRDLLARAGYALSPCDKTDIIFKYFIEHKIYDMIELDIQLEEHGLPCIIT